MSVYYIKTYHICFLVKIICKLYLTHNTYIHIHIYMH